MAMETLWTVLRYACGSIVPSQTRMSKAAAFSETDCPLLHIVGPVVFHSTIEMRHLDERSFIGLPRPQNVIHHRKQHDRPRHQHAKIHMRGRDRRRHGPKAEEEDDDSENDRPNVDDDAKDPRKTERPPDELIGLAGIICSVFCHSDSTCASSPEEQCLYDYV